MRNAAVAVDTGLFVALFNGDDLHHPRSMDFISDCHAELVSNLACVTEAMYLLQLHPRSQINFLEWIHKGSVTLEAPDLADYDRANELMQKYADLPMDFADGLLVAMCERLNIQQVATVDSDFDIYRYKGRGRFKNLF